MTDKTPTNIDTEILDQESKRRRDLLPKWIKVFSWIFLIFGIAAMIAPLIGMLGYSFELSLYGITSNEPLSIIGLMICFLYSIKAVTALFLIQEQENAIFLAIIDATAGIVICGYFSFIHPVFNDGNSFSIRLELVALIPYFIKMWKIKDEWRALAPKTQPISD